MFIGEYAHTIDQKGRMAVPAKFRNSLKQGAVVTRGLDNCLFLYSKEEWKKIAEKLAKLPISQANARGFARLMLAGAMDIKIDSQGRVLIPEYLRKYADMKKNVIVAGLYNYLEIWSENRWNAYKQKVESNAGDMAEKLGELGI